MGGPARERPCRYGGHGGRQFWSNRRRGSFSFACPAAGLLAVLFLNRFAQIRYQVWGGSHISNARQAAGCRPPWISTANGPRGEVRQLAAPQSTSMYHQ